MHQLAQHEQLGDNCEQIHVQKVRIVLHDTRQIR